MYLNVLILFSFSSAFFIPSFLRCRTQVHLSNTNYNEKNVSVYDSVGDVYSKIPLIDHDVLKHLNYDVPGIINSEDDIQEDSFEGYLRTHYRKLNVTNGTIDFETFYDWRVTVGTLLEKDEVCKIFDSVVDERCNLLNFILINKIIDEQDGAIF